MKKTLIIFFFIISGCIRIFSQGALDHIAKNYFRSNPFETEFSRFLQHLMNDPTLTDKKIEKRTDTSLFYLKGRYTHHNPFPFIARRTEVLLTEITELTNDSIPVLDTFFVYQLIGYTDGDQTGRENVKKEFDRFDRKYKNHFADAVVNNIEENGNKVGVVRNYFFEFFTISPVTCTWGTMMKESENVFIVTLRFKVIGNLPVLL